MGVANGGTGVNATATAANQVFRASPKDLDQRASVRWLPRTCRSVHDPHGLLHGRSGQQELGPEPAAAGDSQTSYFVNMMGDRHDDGTKSMVPDQPRTATIQLADANGLQPMGTASTAPRPTSTAAASTLIANGDALNFSLSAITGSPTRMTVCFSAKVN